MDILVIMKLDEKETEPQTCKGRIYKLVKNEFVSSRGDIVFKNSFVLQKRKSCPGCEHCDWINDDIANAGVESIVCKDFKEGAFYELQITNMSKDWESGYVDDYDLELVEVKL